MTPTEKKNLAIRLGVPVSVLLVALILYSVHRLHRDADQGKGQEHASGTPGVATDGSAVATAKTASGSGSGSDSSTAASPAAAPGAQTPRKSGAQTGAAPVTASAPVETCFTVTYRHKALASHSSEEACSRHRNLIRLKHANINAASVCVRVNGTPVKFQRVQGHSDELLIGAIAGPQAKITARYCIGRNKCDEDCTIPKDEFMDAIGGSDDDGSGTPAVAQWDSNDAAEKETAEATAKLDSELKRELASDDEGGKGDGTYVFQDWLSEPESAIACGSRQARN